MFSYSYLKEDSLSHYVSELKKIPLLTSDEEFTLAHQWKENNDTAAMDKIIRSHLRLVVKIASGYSGYGLSMPDLVSEGNIGIMQALKHFDPSIGYRFSTYASWWIRAKMQEFIYNSWSIVKLAMNRKNRKLFFSLRKIKNLLGIDTVNEENATVIADQMNVNKEDVFIADSRFTQKDFSVNVTIGENGNSTWQDLLQDHTESAEEAVFHKQEISYRTKILHDALNTLSPREYDIVCMYRLHEPTKNLKEIASHFNISSERVRQIEQKAFLKIQKYAKSVEWDAEHKTSTYQHLARCFMSISIN